MKFDSDSSPWRSPYSGRHRKEPSYLRVVRRIRVPLPLTRTASASPVVPLRITTPPAGK
jgi:hypothetical protein